MSTPATGRLTVDADGRPIPQSWNPRTAIYEALGGDEHTLFAAPRWTRFTDSITVLAASAIFVGATRAARAHHNRIIARAFASHAGTLEIQQSRDGLVWRVAVGHSIAVAAGETRQLLADVVADNWRVRYINGATAQTEFELISTIGGA
ncbi:MAG: hypothetical protein DDT19_01622 [Syntrophomonadaceae bacterium]|nr:hypothetical protein [Bacillota bacterium]